MSQSMSEDTTDNAAPIAAVQPPLSMHQPKEWVKFEEEPPAACSTPKKAEEHEKSSAKSETIVVDIKTEQKNKDEDYNGAVISAKSVQINLDRSGLSRSMTSSVGQNVVLTDDGITQAGKTVPSSNFNPKSASLKTIDLRDASNGRNAVSTSIGNIRSGFANGDTIVTLLPVNTKWPWITPAKFRPELVPEELMAQGLTLTVEDYVHIMEILVNDMRFNMYNICYKRILVLWIFTAFVVLLGLLFSGVTGLTLFGLGVMWLILNAAAIFLCMFVKIKLSHNLERCMAKVNKHLLQHKILLGLDDRGKISCHKVNLCFIYFDTSDCIKKLQEVIEREERDGRIINNDENAKARRQRELQQRMDIDDTDIIIQGSSVTRVSRKQERAEMLLLRYSSRWAHHYMRRRLILSVDSQDRIRNSLGMSIPPRHCITSRCPCQFIEEHLKYKPKGYPPGFTWCAYLSDPALSFDFHNYYHYQY